MVFLVIFAIPCKVLLKVKIVIQGLLSTSVLNAVQQGALERNI
jgi:hypothetical protein